jgi:hypothetical protein
MTSIIEDANQPHAPHHLTPPTFQITKPPAMKTSHHRSPFRPFAIPLGAALLSFATAAPEIAAGPFQGTMDSLKQRPCPEWFRDAKFGIWAHWGPQAVPMMGDWYARRLYEEGGPCYKYHVEHYGHPSEFGYKDIIPLWKAEKWDPERLMKCSIQLSPAR